MGYFCIFTSNFYISHVGLNDGPNKASCRGSAEWWDGFVRLRGLGGT
jgi:hypothetical protein